MQKVEATAEQIEAITAYTFTNTVLCAEAAQMASPRITAHYNHGITFQETFIWVGSNKRLSILGDAVLAKVLCARWFDSLDNQGEGIMFFMRSIKSLNNSKAKRGRRITGRFSAMIFLEMTHWHVVAMNSASTSASSLHKERTTRHQRWSLPRWKQSSELSSKMAAMRLSLASLNTLDSLITLFSR
jgi:dsRNA-specific ribonuclease